MNHCFVPPYLLRHLVESGDGGVFAHTLEVDERLRAGRATSTPTPGTEEEPAAPNGSAWAVHSADNKEELPGRLVRSAGEREAGDAAVDEAATGLAASLALCADFGRDSFDGQGAQVVATVHYGENYDNAFWDGSQLVFGDGDGEVFERFTKPVDVLGHEFAHALIQYTAGLEYRDQPGALNESVADAFAACMKQRILRQRAGEADWLIGEGLFKPGVEARALRDMAKPGTAYDDPKLGKDPQVGHLDDYVVTEDDNGGVHLNSGIPNRAFHLAATAIGGMSWQGAGRIWWDVLTGDDIGPMTDFAGFAAATVAAAGDHRAAVEKAWADVGVTPEPGATSTPAPGSGSTEGPADALVVRRTGGFAGRTVEGRRDLTDDDPETVEARDLLGRVDLAAAGGGDAMPDMFVYVFEVPGREPVSVPQQALTPDLRRLADIVLRDV